MSALKRVAAVAASLLGALLICYLIALRSCETVQYQSRSPDGRALVQIVHPIEPASAERLEVILKIGRKRIVLDEFHGSGSVIWFAFATWTDVGKRVGVVMGSGIPRTYAYDLEAGKRIDFALVKGAVARDLGRQYGIPEDGAIDWALRGGPPAQPKEERGPPATTILALLALAGLSVAGYRLSRRRYR